MNDAIYSIGIRFAAALATSRRVEVLDTFSRVWMRYRKILMHLKTWRFDGVIDGGANIGEFARLVRYAIPSADLLCVEPNAECCEKLRAAGFRTCEAALWSHRCRLNLYQPTEATTSCTVLETGGVGIGEVEAVRLDELDVKGGRLLVKLDLQGAELSALEGMTHLWSRCAGVLAEVSIGPSGNYEGVREELYRRGYYEYATCNELDVDGLTIEADKLWIHRDQIAAKASMKD